MLPTLPFGHTPWLLRPLYPHDPSGSVSTALTSELSSVQPLSLAASRVGARRGHSQLRPNRSSPHLPSGVVQPDSTISSVSPFNPSEQTDQDGFICIQKRSLNLLPTSNSHSGDPPGGPVAKVLNVGGPGSIPGQGTRFHTPQLRVCMPLQRWKTPSAATKTRHSQSN